MTRYSLHFCLVRAQSLSERAAKNWEKERGGLLKPLVDKRTSLGDCEVVLTLSRAAELLTFLQGVRKEGAQVNSVRLEEQLVDDEQTQVEWFILDAAGYDGAFESLCWDLQEPALSTLHTFLYPKSR
jgi:hypothetical protein